jgi:hypothetical protein
LADQYKAGFGEAAGFCPLAPERCCGQQFRASGYSPGLRHTPSNHNATALPARVQFRSPSLVAESVIEIPEFSGSLCHLPIVLSVPSDMVVDWSVVAVSRHPYIEINVLELLELWIEKPDKVDNLSAV